MTATQVLFLLEYKLSELVTQKLIKDISIIPYSEGQKNPIISNSRNTLFLVKNNNKAYYLNFQHDLSKTEKTLKKEEIENHLPQDKLKIWVKEVNTESEGFDIQYTLMSGKNLLDTGTAINLIDNYVMTVGVPQKMAVVEAKMKEKGFNTDDLIISIPKDGGNNENWTSIYRNLIDWIEKRVSVRNDIINSPKQQ